MKTEGRFLDILQEILDISGYSRDFKNKFFAFCIKTLSPEEINKKIYFLLKTTFPLLTVEQIKKINILLHTTTNHLTNLV